MQSTVPLPGLESRSTRRDPIARSTVAAGSLCVLLLVGTGLSACAPFPPQPSRGLPQAPPAPVASISNYGFLSTLADTPGAMVVSVNGFDLQDRHVAAWQPGDAPGGLSRDAGIWLPPGQHVVEIEYVRDIAAGISLTRGQVPFQVAPGRTYIVRPQVRSDFGKVSFTVIDHGTGFPPSCLPWTLLQSRPRDARGSRAGVRGAEVLACRHQARS